MSALEGLSHTQRRQVYWSIAFWLIGITLIFIALALNWWMLWATGVLVVYAGTWWAGD